MIKLSEIALITRTLYNKKQLFINVEIDER